MVECLTLDREAAGRASPASLRCGPSARHIYPSLVLVQLRKTRSCLTERLLMGRKESNQTKTTMMVTISETIFKASFDRQTHVAGHEFSFRTSKYHAVKLRAE